MHTLLLHPHRDYPIHNIQYLIYGINYGFHTSCDNGPRLGMTHNTDGPVNKSDNTVFYARTRSESDRK